ncbi:MAG TPA: HD domain-containing phosphohydrolase [Polyangia bacterium]|nr:HD domain-containing phosphohydrolase [Polyangia bacterium]
MRLAELLCPLAAASDAGAALPPETAQRTALIALGLGRALGFAPTSRSDLLFAGLVRHLGCSATAHEETRLMGDEQELRASLAPVDGASPVQMLAGASRGFAKGRSPLQRARTVAAFMVRAPAAVPRIFAARCEVSGLLGRRLGLSEAAVRALDEAYERFDGKGFPQRRRGEALSPLSGVLAVAEWMAMFVPLPGGEALALDTLKRRAGGQFDPAVVRALGGAREEILAPARRDAPLAALLDGEPAPHRTADDLRAVALVLADFADLKSTFTLGHSRKVAALARAAAQAMGLPAAQVASVELAGWLHDVGRVSVSNAIWDKPGPLDAGEWEKVRAHPQFTERVLCAATPFAAIGKLAAADHERMDGGGYPRGSAPSGAARILAAADLVQSLCEPRPHRPAHSPERAAAIAVEEATAGRLDRAAVNAVLDAAGAASVRAAAPRGLTERESQVLRLMARGQVDKEIAGALGISHRTVHHHNQSIFAKLNVTTRGAAALFAMEQGLL